MKFLENKMYRILLSIMIISIYYYHSWVPFCKYQWRSTNKVYCSSRRAMQGKCTHTRFRNVFVNKKFHMLVDKCANNSETKTIHNYSDRNSPMVVNNVGTWWVIINYTNSTNLLVCLCWGQSSDPSIVAYSSFFESQ